MAQQPTFFKKNAQCGELQTCNPSTSKAWYIKTKIQTTTEKPNNQEGDWTVGKDWDQWEGEWQTC